MKPEEKKVDKLVRNLMAETDLMEPSKNFTNQVTERAVLLKRELEKGIVKKQQMLVYATFSLFYILIGTSLYYLWVNGSIAQFLNKFGSVLAQITNGLPFVVSPLFVVGIILHLCLVRGLLAVYFLKFRTRLN